MMFANTICTMLLITDYNISYKIYLATGRKIILLPKKNEEGLRLEPSPLDQTSTVVFSNFLIFFQMIVASIRLILNDSFKFSSNMIGIYTRRIHQ